jgi:hypothetical protein
LHRLRCCTANLRGVCDLIIWAFVDMVESPQPAREGRSHPRAIPRSTNLECGNQTERSIQPAPRSEQPGGRSGVTPVSWRTRETRPACGTAGQTESKAHEPDRH